MWWILTMLKSILWWWWFYFWTATKGFSFEFILTSGRVLSIQTNPYQALMILHKNWQIKTVERESENDTLELNNQKSWFLTFQLKMQSPWHLAKSPSHLTKCQNASNPNLDVDENGPLTPQLPHPPGLHLPGCLPPLQLPGPGHCRAGYLHPGHKTTMSANWQTKCQISVAKWKKNWYKKRPHLPGNLRSPG